MQTHFRSAGVLAILLSATISMGCKTTRGRVPGSELAANNPAVGTIEDLKAKAKTAISAHVAETFDSGRVDSQNITISRGRTVATSVVSFQFMNDFAGEREPAMMDCQSTFKYNFRSLVVTEVENRSISRECSIHESRPMPSASQTLRSFRPNPAQIQGAVELARHDYSNNEGIDEISYQRTTNGVGLVVLVRKADQVDSQNEECRNIYYEIQFSDSQIRGRDLTPAGMRIKGFTTEPGC